MANEAYCTLDISAQRHCMPDAPLHGITGRALLEAYVAPIRSGTMQQARKFQGKALVHDQFRVLFGALYVDRRSSVSGRIGQIPQLQVVTSWPHSSIPRTFADTAASH